jgi:hypothetical protein
MELEDTQEKERGRKGHTKLDTVMMETVKQREEADVYSTASMDEVFEEFDRQEASAMAAQDHDEELEDADEDEEDDSSIVYTQYNATRVSATSTSEGRTTQPHVWQDSTQWQEQGSKSEDKENDDSLCAPPQKCVLLQRPLS